MRVNNGGGTLVRTSLTLLAVSACAFLVGALGGGWAARAGGKSGSTVDLGLANGSAQTYQARWLPAAKIELDGHANEPAWAQAVVEKHFVFPWKQSPAPTTEFRALWDEVHFYFSYRVQD